MVCKNKQSYICKVNFFLLHKPGLLKHGISPVITLAFVRVAILITCLACAKSLVNNTFVIMLNFLMKHSQKKTQICRKRERWLQPSKQTPGIFAEAIVLPFHASNSSLTLHRDFRCSQIHWTNYTNSSTELIKLFMCLRYAGSDSKYQKNSKVFSTLPTVPSIFKNMINCNKWLAT